MKSQPMVVPFWSPEEVEASIKETLAHLAAGKVLAYPTETVYGFGGAVDERSVEALVNLKGRAPGKPFLLLVARSEMITRLELHLTGYASTLAARFWPGPLTLVLPGGEGRLPPELRGTEGGIAVRHTSQKEVALMISLMGHALTSTSANRPGQPTAPGTDGIVATFGEAEASGELLVLDGGVLGNVPPSTLVDCTAPLPRIIRDGAIPRAELRRRAGRLAP